MDDPNAKVTHRYGVETNRKLLRLFEVCKRYSQVLELLETQQDSEKIVHQICLEFCCLSDVDLRRQTRTAILTYKNGIKEFLRRESTNSHSGTESEAGGSAREFEGPTVLAEADDGPDSTRGDSIVSVDAESSILSTAEDNEISRLSGATEEMDSSMMLSTAPRALTPTESGEVDASRGVGAKSSILSAAEDDEISGSSGATEKMDSSMMLSTTPRASTPTESGKVDASRGVGAKSSILSAAEDDEISGSSGATEKMDSSMMLSTASRGSSPSESGIQWPRVLLVRLGELPSTSVQTGHGSILNDSSMLRKKRRNSVEILLALTDTTKLAIGCRQLHSRKIYTDDDKK
ncbi:uncharacterized protein [Venturia canescens]|uniref:uncharacterized protein n=1 Tax=Venturia canescens TaxID=32260 RepID=UPI001C9D066C|nr:uncharacterized protein LOC122414763 [Venturia canescens]